MERLEQISTRAILKVPTKFSRYLFKEINWSNKLIGISGARGAGKTVLLLQFLKQQFAKTKALY